ncbi:MAG TPA: DUF4388 domain-containing protein [Anaeromyxobacteraceae bacterium]|nr:DUF4388 domain-containing protein [Anaeromyxobacteraceae bacterium]
MRGLVGTFSLMPLDHLVDFLARRKASGSLTCERGAVQKTVHILDGIAVGASSNDPREYLGQLLINFGHITDEQLAKAFETQEETKIRLGKVLTMVGLVTPEVVRDTLALKIRETILDAFAWDSGVFRVDEAPPPPPDDLDAQVALEEIVREAEFRATAWQAFRAQFPTGTVSLMIDDAKLPKDLSQESVDGRLVTLAREGKTIDEIGLALHATDFHLYQRLYALNRQGVLAAAVTSYVAVAPPEERPEQTRELEIKLRASLLDPPRTPRCTVRTHEVGLLRLSATEKYLLARCDGTRDLSQIAELAPMRELELLKAVKKFVDGRIVELL